MKNEQDIVVGSKGGLETKYHSFLLAFFVLFLCFWGSKNIYSSLFFAFNEIRNVQFGVEMRENLRVFGDRIPFLVYPNCNSKSCNFVLQASLNLIRPRLKLIIYLA